jgi:NADPH:quinone reductase-like Zn-dependent oxidoreductase
MKALTIHGKIARLVLNRAVPSPRPDQLLVRVHSVALNPTDWKGVFRGAAKEDSLLGCDYSGTVVSVGDAVTKKFSPGDRIAGVAHGNNYSDITDGAFAEYITVKGDVQFHIPESLSFESASTLALGLTTVDQGLFQKALKLNLPTNPSKSNEFVLIYGGSSATGSLGIQFAKAAGYRVITTCSPRNFDFVKSLGADKAFDYNSPTCAKDINAYTDNKLKYAWDTISLPSSQKIVAEALSSDPAGARSGTILPEKLPREDVTSTSTFMYTIFGDAFVKGGKEFPASKEDHESAKRLLGIAEGMLRDGTLKPHPEKVGGQGLKGVLQGLLDLKNDKVSGAKLVYRVGETPDEEAEQSFA